MTDFYLYKILSVENWKASQQKTQVQLAHEDQPFIHFSTRDQLDKIINKYWHSESEFIILTLDPQQLIGNLVLERNLGGSNHYYHLYDGSIPLQAVIASKKIEQIIEK